MADAVAYAVKVTDANGNPVTNLTVSPESLRYTTKLYLEEGYDVATEPLTELPEGTELDVE